MLVAAVAVELRVKKADELTPEIKASKTIFFETIEGLKTDLTSISKGPFEAISQDLQGQAAPPTATAGGSTQERSLGSIPEEVSTPSAQQLQPADDNGIGAGGVEPRGAGGSAGLDDATAQALAAAGLDAASSSGSL